MKLLGIHVPFTSKATDENTVTPIRDTYRVPTPWGIVVEAFGGMWSRHLMIDNKQTVLAFSAVYACISIISKDIGKLRPRLMQRDDEVWQEIPVPASPVIVKPNRFQTRNQFYEYWIISKLIDGNTYVLKQRNEQKQVEALYIMDPTRSQPLVAPDGEVFYKFNGDNLAGVQESSITVPASEVIHDRHTCLWHPLVGVSPLYANAASASQGNRIQKNSSKFFENMSRPSGQLTAPGRIEEITAERIRREFEAGFSGDNLGRILVTGDDLKFQPFTIPADQAQLIEQMKWTVEDVARPFHVPLYKIGAGSPPPLGSVAALNLEYYQQALQPHIEAIETLMDEGLGLGVGLGIEFDIEGLIRMDGKTRAEMNEIKVRSGTLAPNEARRADNLPPLKGGDSAYMQQQNFSLEALAKRDASDDPFATGKTTTAPANDDDAGEEDEEEAMRSMISRLRSRQWRAPSGS